MSMIDYLPEDHSPNVKPVSDLYVSAMQELVLPFPSVRLEEFPLLDQMTGGFRVKEFSILCGATGVGKTCFLANLSSMLLRQKIPHFVASVETGPTDFIKRVMSVFNKKDMNGGDAIPLEDAKQFNVSHGETFESDVLQLSLYEDRFNVQTLMADIAWQVKHKGCKIAIIDNLNFFLEVSSAANQIIEMDRVIHSLIIFCKKIDVHVIMVMHPKKTEHGRVESEFDIKGSSTAVQESHNIFLLNRPHPDRLKAGAAQPNYRELKVAKMRRRGKFVGRTLMLKCIDSVAYLEDSVV